MRADKIIIGDFYRHKNSPNNYWARPVKILKPKQFPNIHNRIIAECEWMTCKGSTTGLIKHFKPSDLFEEKPHDR